MITVLHERCDLQKSAKDRYGTFVWTTQATAVPCEMTPLSSAEKNDRGVIVTTDYLWHTMSGVIPPNSTDWRIVWRGRFFNVQGNVESHYYRGRLQHREAVVRLVLTP